MGLRQMLLRLALMPPSCTKPTPFQRQNNSAHEVSLICFSVEANKSAGLFHSGNGWAMAHSAFEFKGAYSAT